MNKGFRRTSEFSAPEFPQDGMSDSCVEAGLQQDRVSLAHVQRVCAEDVGQDMAGDALDLQPEPCAIMAMEAGLQQDRVSLCTCAEGPC